MDTILQRLAKFTVDELRAEFKSCGQKPLPITKTTRSLVERRLAKCLWEKQGGGASEQRGEGGTASALNEDTASSGESGSGAPTPQQPAKTRTVGPEPVSPTDPAGGGVAVVNYFAVCIPQRNGTSSAGDNDVDSPQFTGSSDEVVIFQDRKEALCIAKKNKGARFKVFKTKAEAEEFAKTNQDLSTPKPTTEQTSSQAVAEKPISSFRSVKPQDLVALRKTIEADQVASFKELIWSNPRYLINAGDCPTVLQEGSRYNALHVVAKSNRPEICREVLATVQDPSYILLMYPDDPEDTILSRMEYLTDLYLNSPDKGNAETPLHFACKFGHADVAEVLLNHPQCDKSLKNKYGQTASEIVCTWASLSGTAMEQRQKTITDLLHDCYYVPVFRAEDNCTQPVIGQPWSPDLSDHQSSPLFHARPAGAESPIKSVLSVQAYAGPMSPAEAECFRRSLHTPPSTERRRVGRIKRADGEKGVERIGRELASKMRVSWAEYWNFMDTFVDLASSEGLQKLEHYLAENPTSVDEGVLPDTAELGTPGPSSKWEQLPSVVSPEVVVKDLAGDFEELTLDGSDECRDGTDAAEELTTSGGERDQPEQTVADVDREAADGTEPRFVLEGEGKMADASSRKQSPSADGRDASGRPGAWTNRGEGPRHQTVDFEQSGQRAARDSDEIDRTSDRPRVPNQPHNISKPSPDESKLDIGTIATNTQDVAGSDAVDANSSNAGCRSETSPQASPCCKATADKDDDPAFGDGTDGGCPSCTLAEKRPTAGLQDNQTALRHDDAPSQKQFGTRSITQDGARPTTENPASGDRTKSVEAMAPSVAGNGDGNPDVFKTPKAISSCRINNIGESRGALKGGFILGAQPTKTDLHVWRALAEVEVPDKYPCIRHWLQLVGSVPSAARDRWPTPARRVSGLAPAPPRSSQTPSPSPRHLRPGFPAGLLGGSPLALRARPASEPAPGRPVPPQQAQWNGAVAVGQLKTRLFPE